MGCVETKDFKEFEATINSFYVKTTQKLFGRKIEREPKDVRLILDVKKSACFILFTKRNDLKPFVRENETNLSKSPLKGGKSFRFGEDSWISSLCKKSFSDKIVS